MSRGTLLAPQEPFNVGRRAYKLDGLARYWFTYAPALPQDAARAAFGKALEGKTGKVFSERQIQHWLPLTRRGRLILKDPIACFSSEWLANNFELETIVLVRHPAAFAASLKRMKWAFPFDHFLEQDLLMEEHLHPYRAELEDAPTEPVARAALLWKCLYGVLSTYLERNSGWIVKTHEQLSREPVAEIEDLYGRLGLEWTGAVEDRIRGQTKAGNPVAAPEGVLHQMTRDSTANITLWKDVLSREEIARVYETTHDISGHFYSREDW